MKNQRPEESGRGRQECLRHEKMQKLRGLRAGVSGFGIGSVS